MVVKLAVNSALWCYGGEAVMCGGVSKFIAHMTGEYSCDAMATTPIRTIRLFDMFLKQTQAL